MESAKQTCPRILLAEDSDDDAFFFERSIRKSAAQCSLTRARNGKLAIEFLQQAADQGQFIDLVFLDLKMPVMSGFEVLEWLRSANLASNPKVLVLSGSNDHTDRLRAVELGASGYIVKPIGSADLCEHIGRASGPKHPAESRAHA